MHERQLLALANAFLATPRFLLLEKVEAVLGTAQLRRLLGGLPRSSITCVMRGFEANFSPRASRFDEVGTLAQVTTSNSS